jgi:hypothetical protein
LPACPEGSTRRTGTWSRWTYRALFARSSREHWVKWRRRHSPRYLRRPLGSPTVSLRALR